MYVSFDCPSISLLSYDVASAYMNYGNTLCDLAHGVKLYHYQLRSQKSVIFPVCVLRILSDTLEENAF
jgi:hypothetical protein